MYIVYIQLPTQFTLLKNYFVNLQYISSAKSFAIIRYAVCVNAAGPEPRENYFQKGVLLGQKAALNLWHVDTRPNSQKLFPSI